MNDELGTRNDALFVRRCFQLAGLGAGCVAPNPMVGAVLVHEGRVIGEGWHQRWGESHAEVNCLRAVRPENQALIPYSTLFCNLEPCAHFGKTPPCVELILAQKIRRVVVSNTDPNPLVAGKGLARLREAGVEVTESVLEKEGAWLNRVFFTWITAQRPRIILKWAQSADGFLGRSKERTNISSPASLRLVHRWRAECDAILVGAQTALTDNPRLDVRYYFGKSPLRLVFNANHTLPWNHHLLDDTTETWVWGPPPTNATAFSQTTFLPAENKVAIPDLLAALKENNRAALLVEGGANVLSQFLEAGYWDEIRIIENEAYLGDGLRAPQIPAGVLLKEQFQIGKDVVRIFAR